MIRMEDCHRRGEGDNMEKYLLDYAQIFEDQPEDLRENRMIDWGTMKQLWLELVDVEFNNKTVKKFVQLRTYKGATQRDIFELMDKTMLDHRLQKVEPREAYHRHLGDLAEKLRRLRKGQDIEDIQLEGGQKKQYQQARKAKGSAEVQRKNTAKQSKKVSNKHCTLSSVLASKDTKKDKEMDLEGDLIKNKEELADEA